MSSLVVMLPRGHRVKVATNPNMALLAIKVTIHSSLYCLISKYSFFFFYSTILMMKLQDTACTKKGLDPQMFTLEHKGKRVDLSSTVSSTIIIILTYNGYCINTSANSNENLSIFLGEVLWDPQQWHTGAG